MCSFKVPRMGTLSDLSSVLQVSSVLNSYSMGRPVLCTPVLILLVFCFTSTIVKTGVLDTLTLLFRPLDLGLLQLQSHQSCGARMIFWNWRCLQQCVKKEVLHFQCGNHFRRTAVPCGLRRH